MKSDTRRVAHKFANRLGILSGIALAPVWFQAFFTLGANDSLVSIVLVLVIASVLPPQILGIWFPSLVARSWQRSAYFIFSGQLLNL
jgi:hypothetical protein